MLILLLYGAALRISEALSLTLADVDLPAGILTIRESKFYKTRLVPMSPALSSALRDYVAQRAKEHSTKPDASLFLTRNGIPLVRLYRGECLSSATSSGRCVAVTAAVVINRDCMTFGMPPRYIA